MFNKSKLSTYLLILATGLIFSFSTLAINANDQKFIPTVTPQIFSKALQNNNWKQAFLTGEHAQIVFMSISPLTNPNNEIGMEKHKFDQIIIVVSGNAKTVLDGKTSAVKEGDLIFIPKGTEHNVINTNSDKALKIISFYSDNDIPANTIYPKKADEPKE